MAAFSTRPILWVLKLSSKGILATMAGAYAPWSIFGRPFFFAGCRYVEFIICSKYLKDLTTYPWPLTQNTVGL
jgi:hypothetical protein